MDSSNNKGIFFGAAAIAAFAGAAILYKLVSGGSEDGAKEE